MKKTKRGLLLIFVMLILLPLACKKDFSTEDQFSRFFELTERDGFVTQNSNKFEYGGLSNRGVDTTSKLMVLGAPRVNPYTVANFTAAYNELYEPDVSELKTTDYYIKFLPSTHEEMFELAKTDLDLTEYPLDREVIEKGDYYIETGQAANAVIPLYAVVSADAPVPSKVEYVVLASLHLRSTDEDLVRHAIERVGYDPDVMGYMIPAPPPSDPGGGGGGGGGTGYGMTTSECGCQVFSQVRKPGGCIQVMDTQKNAFEGVRRVKVVMKDTWFTRETTMTDDNGCFRINAEFHGNSWMYIKFKSDRARIRGTRAKEYILWEWIRAVEDYEEIGGPYFNNIQVRYGTWNIRGSSTHLYWGAATVNNALHEFHDFAPTDGIPTPPNGLDIFVGQNSDTGYALMSGQNMVSDPALTAFTGAAVLLKPFATLLQLIAPGLLGFYLPDIQIGIEYHFSDEIKFLAFHEITHSSHFRNVGPEYWDAVVNAEIMANGHGDQNSLGAPLISLVESWAEHIGLTYTNRVYTGFANNAFYANWLTRLERTRNEQVNHIPIGLYHDLNDLFEDTNPGCDFTFNGTCGTINDQVSGFTNAQMFALLTNTTYSPLQFINKLNVGQPAIMQTRINNLFGSYNN